MRKITGFMRSRQLLAPALIAIHLALAAWAAFALAQTYDEAVHLSSGYAYWKTGEYRVNADTNTPLARLVAALPLLALDPDPLFNDPSYKSPNYFAYGDRFLNHNRVPAETMLHAGRLAIILILGLMMAWTLYRWGEQTGGAGAGLAALFFYAFNPAILTHVSLITADFSGALFTVLCLYAASRACEAKPQRAWRWGVAGACLGLALASKNSTMILFAILPLSAAMQLRLARRKVTAAEVGRGALALFGGALLALTAVYGPSQLLTWGRGVLFTFRSHNGSLSQPRTLSRRRENSDRSRPSRLFPRSCGWALPASRTIKSACTTSSPSFRSPA